MQSKSQHMTPVLGRRIVYFGIDVSLISSLISVICDPIHYFKYLHLYHH